LTKKLFSVCSFQLLNSNILKFLPIFRQCFQNFENLKTLNKYIKDRVRTIVPITRLLFEELGRPNIAIKSSIKLLVFIFI
jgi:hypothetical protein